MRAIVVGAGMSGAVCARLLAERGYSVDVLEKRNHIGGNCYDEMQDGILCHVYGPHIFHTDSDEVVSFLSGFTSWREYRHRVTAYIDGKYVPVPFGLKSIDMCFAPDRAEILKEKMIARFGMGSRPRVAQLLAQDDPDLRALGEFVRENISRRYTMKQWGTAPEDLDPDVLARVPMMVSEDTGYFADKYQYMPQDGYTAMFVKMLSHPNIHVALSANPAAVSVRGNQTYVNGEPCSCPIFYTGAIDVLFSCDHGLLPWRTLTFEKERLPIARFQPTPVVNYTVSEDFTRIAEYKYLTGCEDAEGTVIFREYSHALTDYRAQEPYYPIYSEENIRAYRAYADRAAAAPNLTLLGRPAEYQYYDMDDAAARAMAAVKESVTR